MSSRISVKLPIGIQDFGELITGGYVYIDKTELIHKIITEGKPYFLSRPRRFGKSLLISTFEAIFSAKRDLFKGLWIDQSDWDWQTYPVIRLDMSRINNSNAKVLEESLIRKLNAVASDNNVALGDGATAADYLENLIIQLSKQNQVVVLVDEYDKPIIDNLNNIEEAKKIRDILRDFYAVLKSSDGYLKFIFLTGVTRFSKVSVFSGLNNLNDITLNDNFSSLLGYTKDEIEKYFDAEVADLAKTMNIKQDACYQQIKEWYNGYRFSKQGAFIYNPFSVLKLFSQHDFSSHWFVTGTPTFLLELIRQREFDPVDFEHMEVSASAFESFEIEDIPTLPLLYQTGYLTIKSYDPEFAAYTLSYPNREVSQAFTESLINYFSTKNAETSQCLMQIARNLKSPDWDYEKFFTLVKQIYGLVPYDLYIKNEAHYQSLFYLMVKLAGIKISAEVHTQKGRVDALLELDDKIIIFEMKLNKTAQAAIDQIKEKKYYEMYLDRHLPIHLVGMNFDGESRTIDDTAVEILIV